MKILRSAVLLLAIPCSAVALAPIRPDARPLLQAGFAFDAAKGVWADQAGKPITQSKILELFPIAELRQAVGGGHALSLGKPEGETVQIYVVASASEREQRTASFLQNKQPTLKSLALAGLSWDGQPGDALLRSFDDGPMAARSHGNSGGGHHSGGGHSSGGGSHHSGGESHTSGGGSGWGSRHESRPDRNHDGRPDRTFQDRNHDGRPDRIHNDRPNRDAVDRNHDGRPDRPDRNHDGKPDKTHHGRRLSDTIEHQDGTKETRHPDGSRDFVDRSGVRIHYSPQGNSITKSWVSGSGRLRVERTRNYGGRSYNRTYTYHDYSYRGRHYYHYHYDYTVYHYYYDPIYYPVYFGVWVDYPYSWGWVRDPWYGYYGWYWHPYRYYRAPYYWMTDYVLADILAAEYAERRAEERAAARAAQQQAISDQIKEEVAQQVREEMAKYQAKQDVTLSDVLKPGHIFVVHQDLEAVDDAANAMTLGPGDLIRYMGMLKDESGMDTEAASMKVVTCKSQGCTAGAMVTISLEDLQAMQNEFSERIEQGIQKMKEEKDAGRLNVRTR